MSPFGALSALAACHAILSSTSSVVAATLTSIPALGEISTDYKSSQSAAGFMVDIRTKKSLVFYGLDANVFPLTEEKGGPEMRVLGKYLVQLDLFWIHRVKI